MGFTIGFWDYITFLALFIIVAGGLVTLVWLASLPGRIAIARKHPDAEAVKMLGYAGFVALLPWMQALIWAFKPTDVVDIRRYPREEAKAIDEAMARLTGKTPPDAGKQK